MPDNYKTYSDDELGTRADKLTHNEILDRNRIKALEVGKMDKNGNSAPSGFVDLTRGDASDGTAQLRITAGGGGLLSYTYIDSSKNKRYLSINVGKFQNIGNGAPLISFEYDDRHFIVPADKENGTYFIATTSDVTSAVAAARTALQSEIDTINATQNVVDIVGTKAALLAYDTTNLQSGDKIEVLADESQGGADAIYSWTGSAWELIGSKAPYYSISQIDSILQSYVTSSSLTTTLGNYVTVTALGSTLSSYATVSYVDATFARIGDSYTKAESDAKYALATALSAANAVIAKQESDIQYLYRQVIGGGDLVTETDSGVALTSQPFPLTVSPKALLNYVGGMCKKCENICDFDAMWNGKTSKADTVLSVTKITNGFTATITGTSNSWISFSNYNMDCKAGDTYTISYDKTIPTGVTNAIVITFRDSGGNQLTPAAVGISPTTFTAPAGAVDMRVYPQFFSDGTEKTVSISNIMLVKGSTAKAYEPYFEGIKTAPVANVASIGQGEITQLAVGDKVAYVDVPPLTVETSVWQGVQFRSPKYDPNKSYYEGRLYDYYIDRNVPGGYYDVYRNTETGVVRVEALSTGINKLPYVMDTVTVNLPEIKNATKIVNYPIPSSVKSLDGYGYGLTADCNNYIDFERKMFVKKVARVGFATLTINATDVPHLFSVSGLGSVIKRPANSNELANILTSKLDNASANAVYAKTSNNTIGFGASGPVWIYLDDTYDTPEQVHAALDGDYLYYELATPVETDISEYIDSDVIEVIAGGYLEFDNENDMGVPYSVTYQCEANP